MSTPTSRRSFLATLLAAPVVLMALSRARAKGPFESASDWKIPPLSHFAGDRHHAWPTVMMVPSNRFPNCILYLIDSKVPVGTLYVGPWDGKLKLECCGCTNPAYILADLCVRDRQNIESLDWKRLYAFGRWCDEPVEVGSEPARWASRLAYTGTITKDNRAFLKEAFSSMMEVWDGPNDVLRRIWIGTEESLVIS